MRGTPENKEYRKVLKLKIKKEATDNGVSFEQAALIADEIKKKA